MGVSQCFYGRISMLFWVKLNAFMGVTQCYYHSTSCFSFSNLICFA